ncbi:MAG: RsmD family RNA methyltransferase [Muribaculum sp.]|nr:RsmD family RNA methyltransferase [Muribaculum sp.]
MNMEYGDDFWTWVHAHVNEDPLSLRLRWSGKFPWIDDAIMQIECRRKTAKKLPEELKFPRFLFPTLLSAEQSTSDTLADFHASLLPEGIKVLDMTSGLGIDAIHLARGGISVTAVDIDERVAEALSHNVKVLGLSDKVTALWADSTDYIRQTSDRFDAVFIDPARRGDNGQRLFSLSDCHPNVVSRLPHILNLAPLLIVKASPMLDLTQTARDLPGITALYVVGTNTECRELVAVVMRANDSGKVPVIHIWTPSYQFSFTVEEEKESEPTYADPISGDFLYEPSEVTMKAAPWRTLSARFDIGMLHPNSHLYCSDKKVDGFPGDCWHIDRIIPFSSSEIKRFARQYPKINVAVRNFGWTADKLRDKLRVKDGGDFRLMATTLLDGTKVMMVLSRAE